MRGPQGWGEALSEGSPAGVRCSMAYAQHTMAQGQPAVARGRHTKLQARQVTYTHVAPASTSATRPSTSTTNGRSRGLSPLPLAWHKAEHHVATCCARARACIRARPCPGVHGVQYTRAPARTHSHTHAAGSPAATWAPAAMGMVVAAAAWAAAAAFAGSSSSSSSSKGPSSSAICSGAQAGSAMSHGGHNIPLSAAAAASWQLEVLPAVPWAAEQWPAACTPGWCRLMPVHSTSV